MYADSYTRLCSLIREGDLTSLWEVGEILKRTNFSLEDLILFKDSFLKMLDDKKIITFRLNSYLNIIDLINKEITRHQERLNSLVMDIGKFKERQIDSTLELLKMRLIDQVFHVRAYVYGREYIKETLQGNIMFGEYIRHLEGLFTCVGGEDNMLFIGGEDSLTFKNIKIPLSMIGFIPTTIKEIERTVEKDEYGNRVQNEYGQTSYTWMFHVSMPDRRIKKVTKEAIWPFIEQAFNLEGIYTTEQKG